MSDYYKQMAETKCSPSVPHRHIIYFFSDGKLWQAASYKFHYEGGIIAAPVAEGFLDQPNPTYEVRCLLGEADPIVKIRARYQ
ncbi:MAG: hypothetical protein DMF62_04985 [Acidobacteria bacterium]|nr:MAG: hypothetical protein DMF62_04985 [Acidobacteriota bacterium]